MRQTKEQHREYMRQWRAKKKPLETKKEPIVEPEPTSEMSVQEKEEAKKYVEEMLVESSKTNVPVMQIKSNFRAKRKLLIKFVRFDLFHPSSREECLKVRLQKLGLFHEDKDRLEEHMELCEGCRDWLYNLMESNAETPMLVSLDGFFVLSAYANDFPTEESFRKRLTEINGKMVAFDKKLEKITVVVDPNESNPNKIEYPTTTLDLSKIDLFSRKEEEKPKRKPEPLHPNEKNQNDCQSYRDPDPKPEQQPQQPEQQQPQQPRKSYNPNVDDWLREHSG